MSGKQRNIRKRKALDEQEELDNDNDAPALTTEDIKLLQKERQRKTGVNAAALVVGGGTEIVQHVAADDEEVEDGLQVAFKQEKRRATEDEDVHMKKYIEQQLAQRLGRSLPEEGADDSNNPKSLEEAALEAVNLKQRSIDTEITNSWVAAGVTEVPLDMKHRLKNIEATEAAKAALLNKGNAGFKHMRSVQYNGDDDDDGGGGNDLRRSAFPVGFGQRPKGERQRVEAAVEKKQRMKALQDEKKRKKQNETHVGWS